MWRGSQCCRRCAGSDMPVQQQMVLCELPMSECLCVLTPPAHRSGRLAGLFLDAGVVLIPEGLVEHVHDVSTLIAGGPRAADVYRLIGGAARWSCT